MGTDWEFYNPQPDEAREAHEKERIEFLRNQPLDAESNWRLILVQLDDFGGPPPPDFFFDRRREELRRRGFSDADVGAMERIAREFVLPYNDQLPYPNLWPSEDLLEPAIEWHYGEGKIDEVSRNASLAFARRCRRQG